MTSAMPLLENFDSNRAGIVTLIRFIARPRIRTAVELQSSPNVRELHRFILLLLFP